MLRLLRARLSKVQGRPQAHPHPSDTFFKLPKRFRKLLQVNPIVGTELIQTYAHYDTPWPLCTTPCVVALWPLAPSSWALPTWAQCPSDFGALGLVTSPLHPCFAWPAPIHTRNCVFAPCPSSPTNQRGRPLVRLKHTPSAGHVSLAFQALSPNQIVAVDPCTPCPEGRRTVDRPCVCAA